LAMMIQASQESPSDMRAITPAVARPWREAPEGLLKGRARVRLLEIERELARRRMSEAGEVRRSIQLGVAPIWRNLKAW
jgi:hypothetical protein